MPSESSGMKYLSAVVVLIVIVLFVDFSSRPVLHVFHNHQQSEKPLIRDFMGINAHNVEFNPDLFSSTFDLVRDYHTVAWDLPDGTSQPTTFPYSRMVIDWNDPTGLVGDHRGRVNWEKIYGDWKAKGFDINVSLMVVHLPGPVWDDLEEDAYQYGRSFAGFFGSRGKNIVRSVEIGNEPVPKWSLEDYKRLFPAMARGIRDGDPEMLILTAAAQPGKPDEYSVPLDMYLGLQDWFDVIKIHRYPLVNGWPFWERSFPENPNIRFLDVIKETIEWRNRHAPGKEIWITEFGYDATTGTPDPNGPFNQWNGVSDKVQAQWLVRSYLEFSALDVARAYIYMSTDYDDPSFHGSSGIMRNNKPKKSFWAVNQFREILGDYRFKRAIRRNAGHVHVFEYVHGSEPDRKVWVAWSPTGQTHSTGTSPMTLIQLEANARPARIVQMAVDDNGGKEAAFRYANGLLEFELSESPSYIIFGE